MTDEKEIKENAEHSIDTRLKTREERDAILSNISTDTLSEIVKLTTKNDRDIKKLNVIARGLIQTYYNIFTLQNPKYIWILGQMLEIGKIDGKVQESLYKDYKYIGGVAEKEEKIYVGSEIDANILKGIFDKYSISTKIISYTGEEFSEKIGSLTSLIRTTPEQYIKIIQRNGNPKTEKLSKVTVKGKVIEFYKTIEDAFNDKPSTIVTPAGMYHTKEKQKQY